MDSFKTFIPGCSENVAEQGNGLYSRAPQNIMGGSNASTVVPNVSSHEAVDTRGGGVVKSDEPVIGFLYSVSRQGIGEYWPLHLGANTIGRANDNDVQLLEGTVSDHHATIFIKQMKTTQVLIASVKDTGSKNGMYLNDEELDYENHACKNGDVLTIGTCYKLLVMLINAKEYGLSVAENFVPVASQESENDIFNDQPSRSSHYDDGGTVNLDGNMPFASGGETQIM